MSHHRLHILEKVQVYVAAAVALAASYFVAWPLLRPTGPEEVLVFVPMGAWGALAGLAVWAWLLGALCGLLTPSARPAGALLATLVGLGGLCLRSASLQPLLLTHENALGALLRPVAVELVLLAMIVGGAGVAIVAVRAGLRRVVPGWVRPVEPLPLMPPPARSAKGKAAPKAPQIPLATVLGTLWRDRSAWPELRKPLIDGLISAAACMVATMAVGYLVLRVVLFDPQRGQILFALAVAFLLGGLAGGWFFPTGLTVPALLAVVVVGVMLVARNAAIEPGPLAWTQVETFAHALPLDWIAAGGGGAVGGSWLAERIRDAQNLPKPQDEPLVE